MTRCGLWLLAGLLMAQTGPQQTQLETARALRQKGAAEQAARAYESVLREIRQSGDRKLIAQVVLEAGQAALAAGRYPFALERGNEAASLFQALHDSPNEAHAHNLSGTARLYTGEYAGAHEQFQQALEIDRRTHDARGEINRLNNIANVYFFQGRYLEALENYQTALRRAEQSAGESWSASRRQLELTNLAILYEQLGQNQKALDYYKQALAGPSALNPGEHGQLLSNVGTLYRRLGDAVKALETYREAQKLFEREHLSDAEIHMLQNVGIALALDLRDTGGAAAAFTQALTMAESKSNRREIVLAHLFRGESELRAGDWKSAAVDFNAALAGAREMGAAEEEWTGLYGRARVEQHDGDTRAALDTLRQAIAKIESVRATLGVSSLKSEFLANKRDVYDAAIGLMLDSGGRDPEALFGLLEQARARNLRDAITAGRTPPTLKAAQARLASGTVLLEYWMGPARMAVLAITREGASVFDAVSDPAAVRGLPELLRGPDWRGAASVAGSMLLKTVSGNARHLVIVPDGALYRIPFEALALPNGRLAIEQATVSYLPSAALLLREARRDTPIMPWRRQLLGLGDPLVDGDTGIAGDPRWARLPEAEGELRSIAGQLPGRAEIRVGRDDRKQYLGSAPLLHLATHAIADATDANRSRILFSRDPGRAGSDYLFRAEAAALPLAGTDLVTLSACDTEAGALSRGEGVQSFSRAFLAAGARTTVTTLWRVEDRATREFMSAFYRRLALGEAKAEALRGAKLAFLNSGSEYARPLYWAAFVLNGDGMEPIPPVLSWAWIVLIVLTAAALFTAYRFLSLRHRRLHQSRHPHLHPKS
jgi:tetratricopeptide (TPR) repeat protein